MAKDSQLRVVCFCRKQKVHVRKSSGHLYNTSRSIEGHYFDFLQELQLGKKQWAIGPFNPVEICKKPDEKRHKCLEWPMHSDQLRNAALITKVLQNGTIVEDWDEGNDLVESLIIENAVKKLMASREGDEMRKRAAQFSDAIKKSVAEGGVSRIELDSFVAHITR
ncbi:hypothetical protein POM88_014791 [Heracleum sosnowskyi]|uniref:Glycosyltransferase N-terminal domain-containing protein n=1 Tax=Heracleum sosnowskyi TaxID=360622 RepID=A0AAD8MWU9_9APIA|nr:hypothetical protein POM88_014791 [Heracleum sosnowskyi]